MNVLYDIAGRVVEYGQARFYEHVREHILQILETSGLEVSGDGREIADLYQKYASAYILGCAANSVELFIDNLMEDVDEAIDGWQSVVDSSGQDLVSQGLLHDPRWGPLVVNDVMGNVVVSESVLPFCHGDESGHAKARDAAIALFQEENGMIGLLRANTGLASVVATVFPGVYINHYGDDYNTMVMVCEHASLL